MTTFINILLWYFITGIWSATVYTLAVLYWRTEKLGANTFITFILLVIIWPVLIWNCVVQIGKYLNQNVP